LPNLYKWSLFQYLFFRCRHPASYSESDKDINILTDNNGDNIYYLMKKIINNQSKEINLIVYCHGNSADIGHCRKDIDIILDSMDKNYIAIAVEYNGYGLGYNHRLVDDTVIADNTVQVIEHVQNNYNIDKIIIIGRSIGTGVACQVADKLKQCGELGYLVLISPFTSTRAVVARNNRLLQLLLNIVMRERFNNEKLIADITCPVLFIHGKDDTLIPPNHSYTLYSKSASVIKKVELIEGSHANISKHKLYILIGDTILI